MHATFKQVRLKHSGFVCFSGLMLAIYLGLAGILPLSDPAFFTATALLVLLSCLVLWIALSFCIAARSTLSVAHLFPKTAFPFIALLLFALFLPEFFFGTPSTIRLFLISLIILTFFLLFFFFVISSKAQLVVSWVESASPYILCLLVIFHTVLTIILVSLRHANFGSVLGEDTAYYNQIFLDTLNGGFFKGSLTQERYIDPPVSTEFAIHNSPLLFAILPFYYLYPSFYTLLILRNLALSLSSIPIFILSKEKINGTTALLISITYLFSEYIFLQSINAFYTIQFSSLFLSFSFLLFFRARFIYFIIFFILTLSVREELALTMFLFGFYAFFQKRKWPWIVIPSILSILWWYVSTAFIMVGSKITMEDLDNFFNVFGKDYNSILVSAFTEPLKFSRLIFTKQSTAYLYELVKPSAMLSFLSIESIFILPTVFMNLLVGSFWRTTLDIAMHYSLVAFVCLYISVTYGLECLSRSFLFFQIEKNIYTISLTLLLIPQTVIGLKDTVCHKGCSDKTLIDEFYQKEYHNSIERMLSIINQRQNVSVSAPNILLPQLSHYRKLYCTNRLWRYKDIEPNYIILDVERERMGNNDPYRERYESLVATIQQSDNYRLIFQESGFELYQLKRTPMVQSDGKR